MTGPTEDIVVTFENVFYAYGRQQVLEDVSLEIAAADFVAVVGPNGGGKTTLLKLILGLLRPTSGRVLVFGDSPEKVSRRIGYMPQHAHLDPRFPVSVLEVTLMGRLGGRFFRKYGRHDREQAMQALEQTGVGHLADRNFSEISGGQRQRVLIARALCTEPDMLLLDEPTANVDPGVEEALLEVLGRLNQQMTILMVSHDIGFVSQHVKRVFCVNRSLVIHPTSVIDGRMIKDIYGSDVRMVRHDHRCRDKEHEYGRPGEPSS